MRHAIGVAGVITLFFQMRVLESRETARYRLEYHFYVYYPLLDGIFFSLSEPGVQTGLLPRLCV